MEIRKKWHRCWSKPDPTFIQQSQYLADSQNSNYDVRRIRSSPRPAMRPGIANGGRVSSESSSFQASCLCKWTLDKNGKLRRSFVKPHKPKNLETKM